jgi:hypothetical protein
MSLNGYKKENVIPSVSFPILKNSFTADKFWEESLILIDKEVF